MKVVINKCYGGFNLSSKALFKLQDLGSQFVRVMEPEEYYGKGKKYARRTWEERFKKDKEEQGSFGCPIIRNDKILIDDYKYNGSKPRACPLLVQVVEEIGEESYGGCAELKIVEIPDDIDFEIEEYDGMETVSERHQTWG